MKITAALILSLMFALASTGLMAAEKAAEKAGTAPASTTEKAKDAAANTKDKAKKAADSNFKPVDYGDEEPECE